MVYLKREDEITARELKEKLDKGEEIFILDVREHFEYQICRLEGSTLIPLSEVSDNLHLLDKNRETVVYCHAGVRSALAVDWMRRAGFSSVKNLEGGIDAWAIMVDPSMPRY